MYIRTILRHRTGAKQRPRKSRRPSAAKSIIRAEVPKDTGPIYLQARLLAGSATPRMVAGGHGERGCVFGTVRYRFLERQRIRP